MAIIRQATGKDITRILELYEQLAIGGSQDEMDKGDVPANHEQAFEDINKLPGCDLLVAEENGEIVGTAMVVIVPNLSHKGLPWAIVENVVVDEKCRRSGIGKLLMDEIAVQARKAGCYKVQLLSHKTRDEAHRFYSSIGYKASAEGFRLYI